MSIHASPRSSYAVSEVVGALLLVVIALAAFAVIYLRVFPLPMPPAESNVKLAGFINDQGLAVLQHIGGETVQDYDVYVAQSDGLHVYHYPNCPWPMGQCIYPPINQTLFAQERIVNITVIGQNGDGSSTILFQGTLRPKATPPGPSPPGSTDPMQISTLRTNSPDEDLICYSYSIHPSIIPTTFIYNWMVSANGGVTYSPFSRLILPFDTKQMLLTTDYSGLGNNGTVTGPTWVSSGRVGAAYQFGGHDLITIPYCFSGSPLSNVTIEAWVKTSQAQGTILSYNRSNLCELAIANGHAKWSMTSLTDGTADLTGATAINDNTWHFIAAQYNATSGNASLYVDGRLDARSHAHSAGRTLGISQTTGAIGMTVGSSPRKTMFNTSFENRDEKSHWAQNGSGANPPITWSTLRSDDFEGPLGTWWNQAWTYAKTLQITNPVNSYQMRIIVSKTSGGTVACQGHCRDTFGDIRFIDKDNTTQLPYWMENYTSGVQATFWVNTSADVAADHCILMYYGNPTATTTSNGNTTFLFFDHFSTLNAAKWTTTSGSPTAAHSILYLNATNSVACSVKTASSVLQPNTAVEACIKTAHNASTSYSEWFNASRVSPKNNLGAYYAKNGDATYAGKYYSENTTGSTALASISKWSANVWHRQTIAQTPSTAVFFINGTNRYESSTRYTSCSRILNFYTFKNSGKIQVEWVAVRKFNYTEPSWGTIGSQLIWGWGNYTGGGTKSDRIQTLSHHGQWSILLSNNLGTNSSLTLSTPIDVDSIAYKSLKIDFWYQCKGTWALSDSWLLRYYNGTAWNKVLDVHSPVMQTWIHRIVYINESMYKFPTAMLLQFQSNTSADTKNVTFDQIYLNATTVGPIQSLFDILAAATSLNPHTGSYSLVGSGDFDPDYACYNRTTINISNYRSVRLSVWYSYKNTQSTDFFGLYYLNGSVWTPIFQVTNPQVSGQSAWTQASLTLPASLTSVRLQMKWRTNSLTKFVAIDDLNITGIPIGMSNYTGSIDEVRIYERTLPAEQLYQDYLSSCSGNTTRSIIVSENLHTSDVWKCLVTPSDGTQDDLTVPSNPTTIIDYPGGG